jgi:hypothetical protein
MSDARRNHLVGRVEIGRLGVAALFDVAQHSGQHLGRDLLAGRVVDGRDLDRGAHLPNVAGDLPDELRALVDREDGPALGLALLLGLWPPIGLPGCRR